MSVRNGLDMDWNTWSGRIHSASGGYTAPAWNPATAYVATAVVSYAGSVWVATQASTNQPPSISSTYWAYQSASVQAGQILPACGGPLVLKMGRDVALQSAQSSGLVGNFTLQLSLSVRNTSSVPRSAQMVVLTINSGFFESIRGSSRTILGPLSEQDIISAAPTDTPMERVVGGFSFSSLANVLSKAKSFYEKTKPIVSAVKGALPSEGFAGKVKDTLGAVGYGVSAGAPSGGRRGKMSLAERLM